MKVHSKEKFYKYFTIKETWGIWENTLEKNLFSALQCSQCEFVSSHKRSLKIHLLAHSGEKAHKCNQCDYATTQWGRLKTHMQTHTGERPYKCIQCDHTFFSEKQYEVTHKEVSQVIEVPWNIIQNKKIRDELKSQSPTALWVETVWSNFHLLNLLVESAVFKFISYK